MDYDAQHRKNHMCVCVTRFTTYISCVWELKSFVRIRDSSSGIPMNVIRFIYRKGKYDMYDTGYIKNVGI